MSETATAPVGGARGRPKGKARKGKTAVSHPKYMEMSISAINEIKEKNGLSRQAILKYIMDNYEVGRDAKAVNTHLKLALKRGISTGVLKHATGQGASGSFRISDKAGPVMRKPRRKSLKRTPPTATPDKVKTEKVKTPKRKAPKKKKAVAATPKSPQKVVAKKKTTKAKKSPKRAVAKKSAAKPKKLKSLRKKK